MQKYLQEFLYFLTSTYWLMTLLKITTSNYRYSQHSHHLMNVIITWHEYHSLVSELDFPLKHRTTPDQFDQPLFLSL